MDHEPNVLVDGMSFTECPRWHDDRLWFVDFYLHQVFSVDADGSGIRVEAEVPEQPAGIGWLPDGTLLVVSARDRRILRREDDGTLAVHADLADHATGQLNDMLVDPAGRAWVGNFGFDLMAGDPVASTTLHVVAPDGTVSRVADDLWFPNGMTLVEGGTLLVDETFGNRVTAFDVADDGGLARRRPWASFGPLPQHTALQDVLGELVVAPDGCATALDAEGCLWLADALGGRAVRVREGGEILDEVSPGTGVYACALGGPDGRTLVLCTAPDFLEHNRRAERESSVLATTVDVPVAG